MSSDWLHDELKRAITDATTRVVVVPGRSRQLLRAAGPTFDDLPWVFTDGTHVGVDAGGGVQSLVRGLFVLPDDRAEAQARLEAQALEADPQGRELLAFAAGIARDDAAIAGLDARSRWEGALGELARWLALRPHPWVWLVSDAAKLDGESLRLLSLLAGAARPALIVLGLEGQASDELERALKDLAAAQGGAVVHLAPPAAAAHAAPAAQTTVGARIVATLSACGGRLPLAALVEELGPCEPEVETLRSEGVLGVGRTRRSGADPEVWLPGASHEVSAVSPRIAAWAERQLLTARTEGLRAFLIPLVVRAAEAAADRVRASLAWELLARETRTAESLARAEATASGVRRMVLARRLAEDFLFRGDPKRAGEVLAAAARITSSAETKLPEGWLPLVEQDAADELEQWLVLTPDEAMAAIELARAEVLSQQAQTLETRRAFQTFELRLFKLRPSKAVSALWLRAARTWSWFASETLGDGALARALCQRARQQAGPEALARGFHAPAFIRAAQIAESHGGDALKARQLADELIAVARARRDVREETVAWNGRAILHLRDGELLAARKGFETSLSMARSIGFRRREAIALHNLGLTLASAGEYADSVATQTQYLALSEQIGNTVARAYAPAAMAQALVMQLESAQAEPLIARARRAAEDNDWVPLVAWARHLLGLLRLLEFTATRDPLRLSQARLELLASLDLLEDRKASWAEELDPAEVGCCLSLSWLLAKQPEQAAAAARRTQKYEQESACSQANVTALGEVLAGRTLDAQLTWFEEQGQLRLAQLWRRVGLLLKS